MATKPVRKRNVLRRYEVANLLFFLLCIVALSALVGYVFQAYRNLDKSSEKRNEDEGILSEVVAPASESCMYYVGTELNTASHRYRSRMEIPATDDGFIGELFGIPGVVEVLVARKLVVLQKSPSARWETIQPSAREVIKRHLHMHQ